LGWFGVGFSEAVGGAGLGLVEEMLLQRECGRYLVSPSVLATVLGAHVAVQSGDTVLAGAFIAGERSVALAIPVGQQQRNGQAPIYALDWNKSDQLLIWNESGMGLFEAKIVTGGEVHDGLDESVTVHAGELNMENRTHWVSEAVAPLALRAQVLLAARLVGLADHACELTVQYVKTREQFGKPIGSFQAVKHRCADMALRVRLAEQLTALAALKVEAAAPDRALQAAAAKLIAAQAAHENGRAAIQLHGGIGFQSECDVHWFMKRAHVYDQAGGAMQLQARRVLAEPSPLW